jgi:formyltetrahydrofolate-dependent phosphoribosylglycinamide formyltransferase
MRTPKLLILISGTGSNLQALIDAQTNGQLGGQIVGVISNRASALGLMRAQEASIPTQVVHYAPFKDSSTPRVAYDSALAEAVRSHHPDLVILAGFMRILTPEFLNHVPCPVINLHPALPGAYAGLNAMERAWSDHETQGLDRAGIMVHEVIEDVDMGPVLDTSALSMSEYESFGEFKSAMHTLEHALIVQVVRDWCSSNHQR